jgi:hypothetical protein
LLKFPLSTRRTKTSPIRLKLENTELHDRLLNLLIRHTKVNARKKNVKKHAISFWGSFKKSGRPFPTTSDIERNKLETWIHQHNFGTNTKGRINEFAYLIDPKATLKHLNVENITSVNKVLEFVLTKALDADKEQKAREAENAAAAAVAAEDSDSDSDSDDDDEHSVNSQDTAASSIDPLDPANIYREALEELEYDFEQATEISNKEFDEWGNTIPDGVRNERSKVCEVIRRKIEKVEMKIGGAKFDVFNKWEKSLGRIKRRFEREMAEVIKLAEASRQSRKRAKRQLLWLLWILLKENSRYMLTFFFFFFIHFSFIFLSSSFFFFFSQSAYNFLEKNRSGFNTEQDMMMHQRVHQKECV